jgi:RimJ/RimL family protein N-acetyltransferase
MEVALRPAKMSDVEQLLEWRGQPDSLAASLLNQRAPDAEEHRDWLCARLADPKKRIWIIEADDAAVGQVRLQDKGRGPEVSISVASEAQGRGIARVGLVLALHEAASVWPGATAIAEVRTENQRSRSLFQNCGFVVDSIDGGVVTFRKALRAKDEA